MGLFSLVSFLVTTSLGTLYPIYLSYKAIKNNNLQSLEILLMFWIVMGVINAIESTFGWFLHWIPFFYQFKSLLMLWLTLPQIQGSTYLYVTYIHPFLLEHEVEIDTWLTEMKGKCRDVGTDYFYQFVDKLKEILLGAIIAPENNRGRINANGTQLNQSENAQESQMDAASSYAMTWIRQFGPTASAIFQPMQNRAQDLFPDRPPNYLSSLDTTSLFRSSHENDGGFRTEADGYQIPDYDAIPVASHYRKSHEMTAISRRPPISQHPSSDSLPNGQTSNLSQSFRSNNLNMSGYDEIGRDEASGSENDSLLFRKPTPHTSSSIQRARSSDGNQITPPSKSIDQSGQRSVSSGSRWFNWSSKNTLDVSESKKQN